MLTLLPFVCVAQLTGAPGGLPKLLVNEFCASNATTLLDEDGEASDWVELHNASSSSFDLAGWGLTDNVGQPFKWVFPPRVLAPGAYLIVFASDKNRSGPELHTNFKLSAGGEYLALVRPNGTVEDGYVPVFPAQLLDVSYGVAIGIEGAFVAAGHAARGYFVHPTPGAANGAAGLPVAPVEFSVPRGFQDAPFSLELSCATAGVEIRYTLDGSAPSAANGLVYAGPIPVSSTTVVRAVARHSLGAGIARATASTYLFAADVLQQSHAGAIARGFPAAWIDMDGVDWTAGSGGTHPGAWYGFDGEVTDLYTAQELVDSLRSLPSVSLAMSIDDWFGYDPANGRFGIYANSTQEGAQWERAASMEFIDPSGGPEVQVECGLEIQGGNSTNALNRSQLSIAMKFLSGFGVKKLEFPAFPGSPVQSFDYLLLDGGRQGTIQQRATLETKRHAQSTHDRYIMDLHRAMGRDSTRARHVHLYLNGLYWGVYNLHERPDETWAADHHGGAPAEYDYVKEGFVEEGNPNFVNQPEPGAWSIVYDIERNGLDESDVYGGQPAYEALKDYVDLADYVDYLLLNFWAMNGDWPQRNWIATARARLSPDFADVNPDVQFRFHSWDAELTLGWEGLTEVGHPFYDKTTLRAELPLNIMWLYTGLLEHAEFAVLFGDRAQAHLGPGGALYVAPGYSALGTPYDPAFPERNAPATTYWQLAAPLEQAFLMEYARWGNYFHAPGDTTPADWVVERQRILEDFCAVRSSVLLAQLRNAGLYPQLDPPAFSQHGGAVPAGYDLALTGPAGATLYYTTDGSDPRLPGGAVAPGAATYAGALDILQRTSVRARAYDGAEWSALVEATFAVDFDVVVNEVLADNDALFPDELGEFEDLIELHNAGAISVDLSGLFLTDDLGDTRKWPIPAGTVLAPGATLVFWADGDEAQGPLHTSFSLSRNGEAVGLFHDEASGNFALDTLVFGPQALGASIGRLPDGSALRFTFPQPSPGARNVPAPGSARPYDARDPARTPASLTHTSAAFAIGQPLALQVDAAPASSAGFLFFGSDPLAAPFGTGTLLAKSDFAVFSLSTDPTGSALVSFPIPALPALIGVTTYAQVVVGATFSDALVGTIGP